MSHEDGRPIDLDLRASAPDLDLVEMGSPGTPWLRSPRLRLAGLVAAALIVGALAGYHVGRVDAGPGTGTTARVAPTTRLLVAGPGQAPTTTGSRCSAQIGNTLQIGLEIVNSSASGTTLLGIEVSTPMAGLRLTGFAWGSCGQLSVIEGGDPYPLPAGATTWVRMTFDVLVPCPAPLPVQLTIQYALGQEPVRTPLGGFPDLGDIPYSGCSESPS